MLCIFFFKQKTAYEMRISDWSSDVCSSDLPMQERVLAARGGTRDGQFQKTLDAHPMGRIATPDEVANAVLFLASDEASFITGASLAVRSEERRVGKECVSTCRSRWSPYH